MIRGMHKNIVMINDFENNFFEQAIFILKPQAANKFGGRERLIGEAKKIIDNYASQSSLGDYKQVKSTGRVSMLIRKKTGWMYFVWTALCVAVGGIVVFFIK